MYRQGMRTQSTDISNLDTLDSNILSHLEELTGVWKYGTAKKVEFFPDEFTTVMLTTSDSPELPKILKVLELGPFITMDLEWYSQSQDSISIYTFCTADLCILIQQVGDAPRRELKDFILRNKFVVKDVGNDMKHLKSVFGYDFDFNYDDVHRTVFMKYHLKAGFDAMIESYANSEPTAAFKNKSIIFSDWDQMSRGNFS